MIFHSTSSVSNSFFIKFLISESEQESGKHSPILVKDMNFCGKENQNFSKHAKAAVKVISCFFLQLYTVVAIVSIVSSRNLFEMYFEIFTFGSPLPNKGIKDLVSAEVSFC